MANQAIRLAVGGDVQSENGTYLQRPADSQLFQACLNSEFAYVLACRQIGKSSLKNAVAARLIEQGIKVSRIDLNSIGQNVSAEEWYFSILDRISSDLEIDVDLTAWWEAQPRLRAYTQRFLRFLDEVALTKINSPIVIFIDEIDLTLSLPFTDDFFAAIRVVHNDRSQYPAYRRMTFVLLGLAMPDELIKDRKRTPFNIGYAIPMRDFMLEECAPLQLAIESKHPGQGETYFQRIFGWTNGHPYLTQRLCAEVIATSPSDNANLIDTLVYRVFLNQGQPPENNLRYIQDRVLGDRLKREMLQIYERILAGKLVLDDRKSQSISRLKLYGLVVSLDNRLFARNRIYQGFFNLAWAKANVPRQVAPGVQAAGRRIAIISMEISAFLAGYKWRYLEYLGYLFRRFDTRGLTAQGAFSIDLDKVYIELMLRPLNTLSRDGENSRSIWEFLGDKTGAGQRLVIVGSPGSGKTTLLKHIALVLASRVKRKSNVNFPARLPIFLTLREHARAVRDNPNLLLSDVVENSLARMDRSAPRGWFQLQLQRGHCIILMDGLDEVADPLAREQLVEWVQYQMIAYPKNFFIISSRPYGFRNNPLLGVKVLQIEPFTRDQVQRFIYDWYLANKVVESQRFDRGVEMLANESAEDLLRRMSMNSALAALAVNPLLIVMIATVYSYKAVLPGRRVDLYRDILNVLLERRSMVWRTFDLNASQTFKVLQVLAYHMMVQRLRAISREDALHVIRGELEATGSRMGGEVFLDSVEELSGILFEGELLQFYFAHLTFQEYLASVYIVENESLYGKLVGAIQDSWWSETIRLVVAQTDATRIITACLEDDPPVLSTMSLAIDCVNEALKISPSVRHRFTMLIDESIESNDPMQRALVAEARLSSRTRWMESLTTTINIDYDLVSNVEYQLFLDEMRSRGEYVYPDHWTDTRFSAGQGRVPVLGVRSKDALLFCNWLTLRDLWHATYRIPTLQEALVSEIHDANRNTYWVLSGENVLLYSKNSIASGLSISQGTVTKQIEDDLNRLGSLLDGMRRHAKARPTTIELLERQPAPLSRSAVTKDSILHGYTEEVEIRNAFLWEYYGTLSGELNLELSKIIQAANLLFLKKEGDKGRSTAWLPSRASVLLDKFDLENTCVTLATILNDKSLRRVPDEFSDPIADCLSRALELLQLRQWAGITISADRDLKNAYDLVRWYARLCAVSYSVSIAKNMTVNSAQQEVALACENLIVNLVFLEERIRGKEKAIEGVRLVKVVS